MARRGNAAAMRGAPTLPKREEFVAGMARRGNAAAMRDAQTKPVMEEFASRMVQRRNASAKGDAPSKSLGAAFVSGMVRILLPPPSAKWNAPLSLPRAAMPRQWVPEGAGTWACAICIRTSVLPLLVNHPPFLLLQPPHTFPTKRQSMPGFTSLGAS